MPLPLGIISLRHIRVPTAATSSFRGVSLEKRELDGFVL